MSTRRTTTMCGAFAATGTLEVRFAAPADSRRLSTGRVTGPVATAATATLPGRSGAGSATRICRKEPTRSVTTRSTQRSNN
eukprot:12130703-Heterocapsa_arctica.AAC.1